MITALRANDVEHFRCMIANRLGLQFEDRKLGFLGEVLRRRLDASGRVGEAWLSFEPSREELGALAQELTVSETYFFRHMDQFRAFAEVALPERVRAQADRRRLRVLSAGCASGEEAYSLAILMLENLADPAWEVSTRGIDVNPVMPRKAERARYSSWALRETPLDVQRKWFRQEGNEVVLADAARRAVTFEERNLVDEDATFWEPESYDAIFCRNVIMYFTPEAAHAVIARIQRALAPGGYLFLGHAESLRGLSEDFHLRHTHGTFYYQRKSGTEHAPLPAVPDASPQSSIEPTFPALGTDAWVETIYKASQRIEALARAPAARPAVGATPVVPWNLGTALELLRKERFAEALAMIHARPPESARDSAVMLLGAVLLVHSGQLEVAERACLELLGVDELCAGARYLLALCREGVGDPAGAVEHDRVAAYLDPTFAMPRLHLGLLARRAGDFPAARRELEQALVLLRREDAPRLLLFGGGFHREALVALCRAALLACEGER